MLLHCKQSCKARFKNDLGQICPKVSDTGPTGWHHDIDYGSSNIKSLLKSLKQTLMDQVWDNSENVLAVTNEADYLRENQIDFQVQ